MKRILLVLTLVSCGGKGYVRAGSIDGFGSVKSAVWLKVSNASGDEEQMLLVSDEGGLCGKMKEVLPAYQSAFTADYSADCQGSIDRLQAIGNAVAPIYDDGTKVLSLYMGDVTGAPVSGSYSSDTPSWKFYLEYSPGNPWLEESSATEPENCSVNESFDPDAYQVYDVFGSLDLDVKDSAIKGLLSGDIETSVDVVGVIGSEFKAKSCEVQLTTEDVLVYYGYF